MTRCIRCNLTDESYIFNIPSKSLSEMQMDLLSPSTTFGKEQFDVCDKCKCISKLSPDEIKLLNNSKSRHIDGDLEYDYEKKISTLKEKSTSDELLILNLKKSLSH